MIANQQLSLLGASENLPRRIALDATSWIEHVPSFISDHEALMSLVDATAKWEQRQRWMYEKNVTEPRLTAEYPVLADCPLTRLREIGSLLSEKYGVVYDNAWLNLYRNQDDSTAWHGDNPARHEDRDAIVPVLSLGETRRFLIRPKNGGKTFTFVVRSGDLIVMGGRCQRDWVHAVPKERAISSARISINFGSPRLPNSV